MEQIPFTSFETTIQVNLTTVHRRGRIKTENTIFTVPLREGSFREGLVIDTTMHDLLHHQVGLRAYDAPGPVPTPGKIGSRFTFPVQAVAPRQIAIKRLVCNGFDDVILLVPYTDVPSFTVDDALNTAEDKPRDERERFISGPTILKLNETYHFIAKAYDHKKAPAEA